MLKRFRVNIDDPVCWQLGLVEREVVDVLEGKHSRVNTTKLRQSGEKNSDEKTEQHGQLKQRKIEADDVCCICQEELLSENRYPVTYCRKGCGNSVHIRCMRVWTDHQRKQKAIGLSESVPCPICREEFAPLGILLREVSEDTQARCTIKPSNMSTGTVPTVQPLQPTLKAHHPATQCMVCQCAPIFGNIYRCQICLADSVPESKTYLCSNCFSCNQHEQHDEFTYREDSQSKWSKVAANRCIPVNLGQNLELKFLMTTNTTGKPSWHQMTGKFEVLQTADLARLPHWTIRVPRMSRLGAANDRQLSSSTSQRAKRGASARLDQFDSELQTIAELGRMNGSQAWLDKWGSLKTTGLLAPGRQCRLCLMTYQIGETVRRLDPGCQHIFHTACIDPWLLHRSPTCPLDGFKVTPLSGVVRPGSLQVSYVTPNAKSNVPDFEGAHFHISAFGLKTPKPAPKAQLLTSPRRKVEENNINNFSAPSDGLSIVGQTILTVGATKHSASRTSKPAVERRSRNQRVTPPHSPLSLTHDWFTFI
ncbi:hypothetical protein P879_04533 [Paragonimus westermani]|uniref:RING-type domain-containing protein n=1 Tax=Paragonimus westermani TaxID=34504 RepID=A0A8T0DQT7_9TREM|nr:hypothetical protein P879_04533 [Paragonimus westermani]